MISIGAIIGGPECAFFDNVLCEFMRHCESEGALSGETAVVNIVYHLPGSLAKPDYIGVRTGKFSRQRRILMIQVAVEEAWIAERSREKVLDYIIDVADESLSLASTTFKKAGIEYHVECDRVFLDDFRRLMLSDES